MPWWLPIAISVAIPIFVAVVNAVINFKIKFSDTKERAALELRLFAINIVGFIVIFLGAGFYIYDLHNELSSPDPLTRRVVFSIAYDVCGLFLSFCLFMYMISVILTQRYIRKNL